jgi:Uncharacterised nucleotidyltransferase
MADQMGRQWPAEAVTIHTARLLWEACRRDPAPDAVWRALDGGADLRWAVDAAVDHRLVPLLWRTIVAAGAVDVLGPQREGLEAAANAYRMEALLLFPPAVALAIRPLTDSGLEPVVLKGPALASRYPEAGLRPMEDIDVLLPKAEHVPALEALQRAGWQVARSAAPHLYDTVLTHPEVPSLCLELHYGLERNAQRVTGLDPLALWTRRQPIVCAGTAAFGLPLTEELVVLAAHAGKPHHRFLRLLWIADLAMIVGDAAQRGTPVDWSAVRAVAKQTHCVTVLSLALAMAQRAGVDVPAEIVGRPTGGRRSTPIQRLHSETWPLTDPVVPGFRIDYALSVTDGRVRPIKVLLVHWALVQRVRRRLRRVVPHRRAAPPTAAEEGTGAETQR